LVHRSAKIQNYHHVHISKHHHLILTDVDDDEELANY
jgi:hypothetical protein